MGVLVMRGRAPIRKSALLPGTAVARTHPLAHAARAACHEVLGVAPPHCAYPAARDAARVHGLAGIPMRPAIGPGLVTPAHGADEHVGTEALHLSADLSAVLGRAYCGGLH
jgi:succinyl-diaminopimelate desuccinylase